MSYYIWFFGDGWRICNSCSVLAHINVSNKGIFISTDYRKNENWKPRLKSIKYHQSWILKAPVQLQQCFHHFGCLDLFSGPVFAHKRFLLLMSLANVILSIIQPEKMPDQSKWVKTAVCFVVVLDAENKETWFNCMKDKSTWPAQHYKIIYSCFTELFCS